ncbi:TPA: aminoacyl-tRNA hydrolase, partial [Clostridioides difficile]|nr:aminoacyl-tRNA hydrolase [Clostridioides difficile]
PRVRVGVSKPEAGQDLADFVLSRFRKEESDNINEALEKAADAIDSIIRENIDMSMNKYNG